LSIQTATTYTQIRRELRLIVAKNDFRMLYESSEIKFMSKKNSIFFFLENRKIFLSSLKGIIKEYFFLFYAALRDLYKDSVTS